MLNKKFSSYKSLVSVGLLSVLLGVSTTACRATEAALDSSDTAVVEPVEASKVNKDNSATPSDAGSKSEIPSTNATDKSDTRSNPTPISAEAAGEESEIDFGDAYVRNDPNSTPISAEAAGEESEIDFGDAYVRNDPNPAPISAEAAGEESAPLKEDGYSIPPADDTYIAEEERTEFFYTGTPTVNIPVADVVASLAQGMPYGEARSLIITNGWEPIVDPTVDTTYDASLRNMHEMGYVEAEACSGTGLGFCSMAFAGKDGVTLSITLTTSSEVPNVWNWNVYTL